MNKLQIQEKTKKLLKNREAKGIYRRIGGTP